MINTSHGSCHCSGIFGSGFGGNDGGGGGVRVHVFSFEERKKFSLYESL